MHFDNFHDRGDANKDFSKAFKMKLIAYLKLLHKKIVKKKVRCGKLNLKNSKCHLQFFHDSFGRAITASLFVNNLL